jgi:hypothetical protein
MEFRWRYLNAHQIVDFLDDAVFVVENVHQVSVRVVQTEPAVA